MIERQREARLTDYFPSTETRPINAPMMTIMSGTQPIHTSSHVFHKASRSFCSWRISFSSDAFLFLSVANTLFQLLPRIHLLPDDEEWEYRIGALS